MIKSIKLFIVLLIVNSACKRYEPNLLITGIDTGFYSKGFVVGFRIQPEDIDRNYKFRLRDKAGYSLFYMIYRRKVYYSHSYVDVESTERAPEDLNIYLEFIIKNLEASEIEAKSLQDEVTLFYGKYPQGESIERKPNCAYRYFGETEIL